MADYIVDQYSALGNSGFWGAIHECKRCGCEVQWHHHNRHAGGRELYTLSTGRPHRCRRSKSLGAVSQRQYKQRIRRPGL